MTSHRLPAAVLAVLSLALVASCGDDDDNQSSSTEPAATAAAPAETAAPSDAAGEAQIVISGSSFGEPISVPVGTTVTVRNDDGTIHTWTSDDGGFDSGGLDQGDTFSFTFDEPGEFPFHCDIHTSMTGMVTVTG